MTNAAVTDWGTAEIDVLYDLRLYQKEVYIGLCWGEEENPDTSDFYKKLIYRKPKDWVYNIYQLKDGTKYYVRAFVEDEDDIITFSDNFSFVSKEEPTAPCSVTMNRLDMIDEDMNSYEMTIDSAVTGFTGTNTDWYMEAYFEFGTFRFDFLEEPISGIYEAVDDIHGIHYNTGDMAMEITGVFDPDGSSWLCGYEIEYGYAGSSVYVSNDKNGTFTISFCNISFDTTSGCNDPLNINGKVQN